MKKKFTLTIALILITIFSLSAQQEIGEILYVEGEVSINRNGEEIDEYLVDVGEPIENYDFIQTGADGMLELLVITPQGQESTLVISPDSSFYIELAEVGGGESTSVEMVTGSIGMKVDKIAGKNQLQVKTESAAMGVRGTKFMVVTTPTGDTLVTCDEGSVSCKDDSGKNLYAKPGVVVEKNQDEKMNSKNVDPSEVENFRKNWFNQRIEVFKANPLKAIRTYAIRYNKLFKELKEKFADLMAQKAVLDKWFKEDRAGQIGSKIEINREKTKIIQHLFKLKKVLFMFERVHFRLVQLYKYFLEGYGQGNIEPGLSTTKFFQNFRKNKAEIENIIFKIKYIIKLYAKRNGGYFPMESSILGEDSGGFFEDSDMFD